MKCRVEVKRKVGDGDSESSQLFLGQFDFFFSV